MQNSNSFFLLASRLNFFEFDDSLEFGTKQIECKLVPHLELF